MDAFASRCCLHSARGCSPAHRSGARLSVCEKIKDGATLALKAGVSKRVDGEVDLSNPPSCSSFLRKQESRVSCENRNPVLYIAGSLPSQGRNLDSRLHGNDKCNVRWF